MTKAIYRLVYLSHNGITGTKSALQSEIDQILAVSRRNNDLVGVTGALMFNTGCFAQVLEGPQASIQDTFERIQCDMRHSKVVVLAFDETGERKFSKWSMAYVGSETAASSQFTHVARESGFNLAELDGERVFALLQEHLREAENA